MLIPLFLVFVLIFTPGGTPHRVTDSRNSPKPDFTGIWNAKLVSPPDSLVEGLKISYDDPKLKISRFRTSKKASLVMGQSTGTRFSRELVYFTDGRGETQKPDFGSTEAEKSKTERIGEKFVTTTSYKSKEEGKTITTDLTATLEISSDGAALTETLAMVTDGNTKRIVHLYDRIGNSGRDINGEWVRRVSDRIVSLTVEHKDPEIKVTRRVISEAQDESETATYYTDGRGEVNVRDGRRMKSVTKWKDDGLVFALSSTSNIAGDEIGVEESIKWQVAKDGGSLLEVTQVQRSSKKGFIIGGSNPKTLVYARSEKPLP